MSLASRANDDLKRVYMNTDHFCEKHRWNGVPFLCVTDEESALKRKNNNVNDVSWDNNTRETLVYVPKSDFPGNAVPNTHGIFDNRPMKMLQVNEDMGMLCIVLVAYESKELV